MVYYTRNNDIKPLIEQIITTGAIYKLDLEGIIYSMGKNILLKFLLL